MQKVWVQLLIEMIPPSVTDQKTWHWERKSAIKVLWGKRIEMHIFTRRREWASYLVWMAALWLEKQTTALARIWATIILIFSTSRVVVLTNSSGMTPASTQALCWIANRQSPISLPGRRCGSKKTQQIWSLRRLSSTLHAYTAAVLTGVRWMGRQTMEQVSSTREQNSPISSPNRMYWKTPREW